MGKETEKKSEDQNIIQVYPEELVISGTYFHQRLKYVTLKNWSAHRVGYKVRPTHPNNYTIKPNVGVMEPNESVLIRVLLYRYSNETFKQKHFLELFASPIEQEDTDDAEVLKHLEKTKDAPAYVRLRIRFRMDEEGEEATSPGEEEAQVSKLPKHLLDKFGGGKESSKLVKLGKGTPIDQSGEDTPMEKTDDAEAANPRKDSAGKETSKPYESSAENEAARLPVEDQVAKEMKKLEGDKVDPVTYGRKDQADDMDSEGAKTLDDFFNNVLSHPDTLFWLVCALIFLIIISR